MDEELFRRKGIFAEGLLKIVNKKKYKKYREDLKDFKLKSRLTNVSSYTIPSIIENTKNSTSINVSHSGNAGDVIYSLATLKELSFQIEKPINLYLKLNQPTGIPSYYKHPSGRVMLNENMATMLIPLIESQNFISEAGFLTDQDIHFDLDTFRKADIPLDRGDIARWSAYFLGLNPPLFQPWLSVEPNKEFYSSIILSRSERYRNSLINYNFLSVFPKVFFVGVESEYQDIKKSIPNIEWIQVSNFKELAEIIAGCGLFIGNQSLPFSIAEGLKVTRLLEVFLNSPNVIPSGTRGHDFIYQEHLEWLVKKFKP